MTTSAASRGWLAISVFAFLLVAAPVWAHSPLSDALNRAGQLREDGDFKGASNVLTKAMQDAAISPPARKELEFQRDILERIKNDYSLTKEDLFAKLKKSVRDGTTEEFEKWMASGWFDGRVIDGQTYYVDTSISNLYFRHPDLKTRRMDGKDDSAEQQGRLAQARAIKDAAHREHKPYVLPHQFFCTMDVTAAKDAAPAGELIRAWLPVPRKYPYQDEFKITGSSSPILNLAPETSPIRSAFLEQRAVAGQPTKFELSFQYVERGVFFDLKPEEIRAIDPHDPELARFVAEAPHVVFTDKITKQARDIAGSEKNPMLVAKAFFDWIGANIQYSFAREYSTLTNISDYCLTHRYGDCGQEALLFITLCRSRGIPARWHTGWDTYPGSIDIHDWTEIYLAPYGWVPVDPWAGIYAASYCTKLTGAERRELHDFYFGGLDYYRMAANSDHNAELDPPKKTMRSDDVDFQRGELEWQGGNIYFDKYKYKINVQEMK